MVQFVLLIIFHHVIWDYFIKSDIDAGGDNNLNMVSGHGF